MHWLIRRPLLDISLDPAGARARGRAVALWDFVFYASFGLVVTSSVRLAGVLLVFSYLIVPAVVGVLLARSVLSRLVIGWSVGLVASALGILAAWAWDLPTGAAIVTTFGAILAALAVVLGGIGLRRRVREHGVRALASVLIATGAVIALAGVSLLAFPAMDQPWLIALEHAIPGATLVFLDRDEREEYAESHQGVAEGEAELARVSQMRDDVQWGRRPMSSDMQERLRQYIAGRQEMVTGDRLVLRALRQKARERQRYGVGLPLTLCGVTAIAAGLWLVRDHRRS